MKTTWLYDIMIINYFIIKLIFFAERLVIVVDLLDNESFVVDLRLFHFGSDSVAQLLRHEVYYD